MWLTNLVIMWYNPLGNFIDLINFFAFDPSMLSVE